MGERRAGCEHIENQVITQPVLGEVLLRVVDDMVGSNCEKRVQLFSYIDPGYLRPEHLGQLYCKRADAAAGPR